MDDRLNSDSAQRGASQQGASSPSKADLARALDELIAGSPSAGEPGSSGGPGAQRPESSRGRCPQPAAWSLLLSGEAQPFEADELFTHAAECPACASILRGLTADASAEELSAVASMSS